jgi:SagB-type dehydrogenase family enzyme
LYHSGGADIGKLQSNKFLAQGSTFDEDKMNTHSENKITRRDFMKVTAGLCIRIGLPSFFLYSCQAESSLTGTATPSPTTATTPKPELTTAETLTNTRTEITTETPTPTFTDLPSETPMMNQPAINDGGNVQLPIARQKGALSVEMALMKRRSVRSYADEALSLEEVAQLLWAGQGITDERGHRTAPSSRASYPLEIYLVVGDVDDLATGVYKYLPSGHELRQVSSGDLREDLREAAQGQEHVQSAPALIVIAAVYGEGSSEHSVQIEAGCAAQNVYLQATALDLGTVYTGGINQEKVKATLGLAQDEEPLSLMPIGKRL